MNRIPLSGFVGWMLVLLALPAEVTAQSQQAQSVQILLNTTKGGKPLPSVQIVEVLANVTKPVGATNSSGSASVALDLSNITKVQIEVTVEECDDGTHRVYLVGPGEEGQLPPEQPNCKRRRADFILLLPGGGRVVTIDFELLTTVVGNAGAAPGIPASKSPFSVRVEAGLGSNIVSSANTCVSFTAIFPGAPCEASNKSFFFTVGGSFNLPHFALNIDFGRGNDLDRNGSAPVNGSTASEVSSFQEQFTAIMPEVSLTLPLHSTDVHKGAVTLYVKSGAVIWNIHEKETTAGGTPAAHTDSLYLDGVSPAFGGGVRLAISRVVSFYVDQSYFQVRNSPGLKAHNNTVTAGVKIVVFQSK